MDEVGCKHVWMALSRVLGEIVGADSDGNPVFVAMSDEEIVYGCDVCGISWTPELVTS